MNENLFLRVLLFLIVACPAMASDSGLLVIPEKLSSDQPASSPMMGDETTEARADHWLATAISCESATQAVHLYEQALSYANRNGSKKMRARILCKLGVAKEMGVYLPVEGTPWLTYRSILWEGRDGGGNDGISINSIFRQATSLDPGLAMAKWGLAATNIPIDFQGTDVARKYASRVILLDDALRLDPGNPLFLQARFFYSFRTHPTTIKSPDEVASLRELAFNVPVWDDLEPIPVTPRSGR